MSPVVLSVNTSFIIRFGDAAGDVSGLSGLTTSNSHLIFRAPLSDSAYELALDHEVVSVDALREFGAVRTSEAESRELDISLNEGVHGIISDLLTDLIDELEIVDAEQCEAEQYIKDFMDDDSSTDIDNLVSSINIDKGDLFDAIFSCTGWEIGELSLSDDPDLSHEIEVVIVFDCNLNRDEIVDSLSDLSDEEIDDNLVLLIENILGDVKSRYGIFIE